jgi:hypothetical protein
MELYLLSSLIPNIGYLTVLVSLNKIMRTRPDTVPLTNVLLKLSHSIPRLALTAGLLLRFQCPQFDLANFIAKSKLLCPL